mgnify:CR=1 FL=1
MAIRGRLFQDWLRDQSQTRQNEILGPARAALFREGKVTLRDLIDEVGVEQMARKRERRRKSHRTGSDDDAGAVADDEEDGHVVHGRRRRKRLTDYSPGSGAWRGASGPTRVQSGLLGTRRTCPAWTPPRRPFMPWMRATVVP